MIRYEYDYTTKRLVFLLQAFRRDVNIVIDCSWTKRTEYTLQINNVSPDAFVHKFTFVQVSRTENCETIQLNGFSLETDFKTTDCTYAPGSICTHTVGPG